MCNPRNVIIFDTLEDGLSRGFTPCLKCHPERSDWKGSKKELAKAAKKLIYEHYQEKFSLEKLAGELYVNESYLARVFKEATGKTPLAYHNYIRCSIARVLLTHNEFPISYISDRVGYVSPSHFTRKFQSQFGCTPMQYRKRYYERFY